MPRIKKPVYPYKMIMNNVDIGIKEHKGFKIGDKVIITDKPYCDWGIGVIVAFNTSYHPIVYHPEHERCGWYGRNLISTSIGDLEHA